jgi:hypothetical protein
VTDAGPTPAPEDAQLAALRELLVRSVRTGTVDAETIERIRALRENALAELRARDDAGADDAPADR